METGRQILKVFGIPKTIFIILITILSASIIGGTIFYFYQKKAGEEDAAPLDESESAIGAQGLNVIALAKRLIQPEDIILEKVDVEPQIPSYNLPLKTEDIANWQAISQKIGFSDKALSLFKNNGFVVMPTPKSIQESPDEFAGFYSALKWNDMPVFITSDSLLHYYHIFFDATLMKMERDMFYNDIYQMSRAFLDDAIAEYNNSSGDLKESAKRNVIYFSVALELLSPEEEQTMSDAALRQEYCGQGVSSEYCEEMIKNIKEQYGDKASFKYFSESDLQKYSFETPDFAEDIVDKELELIGGHEGWEFSPTFIYKEDYSQYVPRGHYTKSEKLKNYFKAMMWYGRMTALINGSPSLSQGKSLCTGPMDGIISEYDAKIQTLQSALIAKKFLKDKDIQTMWQRMYAITSFFVGFSDDLGPYEYSAILNNLFGESLDSQGIEERYSDIKDELLKIPGEPKIYGGLGACELFMLCPPLSAEDVQELKIQAEKLLGETKGFRLMGQRFTVDSWLFSELVSPYSGQYSSKQDPLPTQEKPFTFLWNDAYSSAEKTRPFTWVKTDVSGCSPPAGREVRGFPMGLDIMALLGSKRAKYILEQSGDADYSDYKKKFFELKSEIDSFSNDDWFQNLYWNWLYTLQPLLGEWGNGYQTFMQSNAWQDKELNTALASWSELRHDTLLYVKQSYTMAELGGMPEPPVVGYVEPVPEFYVRLLTLTRMTNQGLKELVPAAELEELGIGQALDRFSEILNRLLEISKKELENKPLSEEEYDFIENFGSTSENLIEILSDGQTDPDVFNTVLIADVHTEGNTEKVLEEGVGYIKTMVLAYKLPDGRILAGVGPTFSYYEFKQPMGNRLTDEAWRELLDSGVSPPEPSWTRSFTE